jgi:D-alanine-D-alanine ligase
MKLNLGLIFGGRSGEHEVSLQSAKSIAGAVNKDKFNLLLLAVDKKGNWYLVDSNNYLENEDDPAKISLRVTADQQITLAPHDNSNRIVRIRDGKELGSLDVAFPIIHGTFGEDGSLQGYLSMLNIPCVGADVLGSAAGMDKLIAKKLLISEGIPVADYMAADKNSDISEVSENASAKFGFPLFVKPACSGSSVGVYKAMNEKELSESIAKALEFDAHVLIEKAIIGREIECSVLGNDILIASIPGEVITRHEFYSYEAKYIDANGAQLDMPAKVDSLTAGRIKDLACRSYKALSCSGMARVDMFLTENGELIMNEINTLPGFTKISMYPKLIGLSGISYSELIDKLVELAIERHNEREGYLKNILKAKLF